MNQTLFATPAPARALLRLDPRDDVATALRPLDAGEGVDLDGEVVAIAEPIPFGHKVALRDLPAGHEVLKFGWPIGALKTGVATGEHVHAHNLATLLAGVEGYAYAPYREQAPAPREEGKFLGYRRADGRVGTRNEIWILPTVGCVGRTAQKIAAIF